MVALTSSSLGITTASEFIDSISVPEMNVNVYVTLSHVESWPDDNNPPDATDSIYDKVFVWRGMLGGKKITGNDISLVVPRINWTNNTVYDQYSDRSSMVGNTFYVMTSSFDVYKCLDNNDGSSSVIQPTYTSVDSFHKESDGYIWKYMFTLTTSDRTRFLSSGWMPVRTLRLDDGSLQWDVQQSAHDGGIEVIRISNGGVGYNNSSNILVSVLGDGVGFVATANINVAAQTISFITVTNPGTSFHYANVIISGGGGLGAMANSVISPFGGHGANPIEELLASNLMISAQIRNSENNKISIQNDYRQISIIKNPLVFGTSNVYGNTVFSQSYSLSLSSGGSDYSLDEYVIQGPSLDTASFSGRVLDWDGANNVLELIEIGGVPSTAALTGLISGTSRFVINSTNYDLVPYSGEILYIDNIPPIQRAEDQDENIQIVFSY